VTMAQLVQKNAEWVLGQRVADGPVSVIERSCRGRSNSTLAVFDVEHGPSRRRVVVKQPKEPIRSNGGGRPRWIQMATAKEKLFYEGRTLSLIHENIGDDDRFGTVKVFAAEPGEGVLIMEHLAAPTLRQLARSAGWTRRRRAAFVEAVANSGAWLRRFHSLEPTDALDIVGRGRSDVVQFVVTLLEYLAGSGVDKRFCDEVSTGFERYACDVLPPSLPMGLLHGDFAMRNVLVPDRGRVAVIDGLGRVRTAIYRDIATFLLSYEMNPLFAGRHPLSIREAGEVFASGYFGDEPVEWDALRLFRIQAMLDKWAAVAEHRDLTRNGARYVTRTVRLADMSARFRRRIRGALAETNPLVT